MWACQASRWHLMEFLSMPHQAPPHSQGQRLAISILRGVANLTSYTWMDSLFQKFSLLRALMPSQKRRGRSFSQGLAKSSRTKCGSPTWEGRASSCLLTEYLCPRHRARQPLLVQQAVCLRCARQVAVCLSWWMGSLLTSSISEPRRQWRPCPVLEPRWHQTLGSRRASPWTQTQASIRRIFASAAALYASVISRAPRKHIRGIWRRKRNTVWHELSCRAFRHLICGSTG
mmetsp:Transcript_150423/g.277404  ORF Transcript_150423/g.277404 Transcript_150423/m.277404 type:complete len:230 (-) Transcript_150423:48-737(-)